MQYTHTYILEEKIKRKFVGETQEKRIQQGHIHVRCISITIATLSVPIFLFGASNNKLY